MLEKLKIAATDTSPEVNFDPSGKLELRGRSLMEDVISFYTPLLNWIEEYLENPKQNTIIILELEYFNSASARMIVKLLMKFEDLAENEDNSVKVIWRYKDNDDIIRDRGREFKTILMLPFELEEIKS